MPHKPAYPAHDLPPGFVDPDQAAGIADRGYATAVEDFLALPQRSGPFSIDDDPGYKPLPPEGPPAKPLWPWYLAGTVAAATVLYLVTR